MAEAVPIIEHQLPAVSAEDREAILVPLTQLLRHQLPAFIMTPSNALTTQDDIRTRGDLLVTCLGQLHLGTQAWAEHSTLQKLDQGPVGILHHDMPPDQNIDPEEIFTIPFMHTTTSGGGDVFAAHVGTNPREASQYRITSDTWVCEWDDPHVALLRGEADPEVINPNIYKGRLETGYSLVTSGDIGRFATWHRFDTYPALGPRTAVLTELKSRYYPSANGYALELPAVLAKG